MAKIKAAPDCSKDKSIISEELVKGNNNNDYEFLCSWCSRSLVRLRDFGNNNLTWWCKNCSIEFDPETENLHKNYKITPPDTDTEPAITSIQTNMTDKVEIRHNIPLRGGFAELQKKGLRIKDYHTTEKQ